MDDFFEQYRNVILGIGITSLILAILLIGWVIVSFVRELRTLIENRKTAVRTPRIEKQPFTDEDAQRYIDLVHDLHRLGLSGKAIDNAPGLLETRLGGPSVWKRGEQFPTTRSGKPLVQLFLAKLDALPSIQGLPEVGYLQVFISDDDTFGLPEKGKPNDGYTVVLHPADADLIEAATPNKSQRLPFPHYVDVMYQTGMGLEWTLVNCGPDIKEHRLEAIYEGKTSPNAEQDKRIDTCLDPNNILQDALAETGGSAAVMLLGNPAFSQADPRNKTDMFDWINLVGFSSCGKAMMWGDVGNATFLIAPEDLEARRFDRVCFSWDGS